MCIVKTCCFYHCLYKIYHYKVSIEKGSTSDKDDGGDIARATATAKLKLGQ